MFSANLNKELSLTNFHSKTALIAVTEKWSLNPSTFVERGIKGRGGAWSVQASIWVFAKTSKLFKSRSAPRKASGSSAQASQLRLDVRCSSVTGVTWSRATLPTTTPALMQPTQKTNPKVSRTIWKHGTPLGVTHKATFPK